MFSSLNVMDDAEYTFYTTFQDHQYKVIGSPAAVFRCLKSHQDVFWVSVKMNQCAPTCTFTEPSSGVHDPQVYMKLRPHVTEFLQSMAKNYEVRVRIY